MEVRPQTGWRCCGSGRGWPGGGALGPRGWGQALGLLAALGVPGQALVERVQAQQPVGPAQALVWGLVLALVWAQVLGPVDEAGGELAAGPQCWGLLAAGCRVVQALHP